MTPNPSPSLAREIALMDQPAGFTAAQRGDMVTINVPNGIGRHGVEWKQRRGRVVMRFATHLVLNGGGRHGTPLVATPENYVRHTPAAR